MKEWHIHVVLFSEEEFSAGTYMAEDVEHALEQFWDDPAPATPAEIRDIHITLIRQEET